MQSSSRHGRRIFAGVALAAAAFFGLPASSCAAPSLGIVRESRIDQIVRYVMADHRIPGLALGISRNGRVLYGRGFGTARRGALVRVTDQTIFAVGSLTKSFTAALALRLIQHGHLSLETPLARDPNATVGEALAMATGLVDYAGLQGFSASHREPVAPSQLYAAALARARVFEPGTRAAYSNTDYLALALTIEAATHTRYPALLQRDILRRYALWSTSVAWPGVTANARQASGDAAVGSPTLGFATADLESDVTDLLRWYALLFDGRIVHDSLLQETLPPTRVHAHVVSKYGDGFAATRIFGRRALVVRGFVSGFSSIAVHLQREHVDIVILTNADRVDLGPLAASVIARTLDIPDALW